MDPAPFPSGKTATRFCAILFVITLPLALIASEIGRLAFNPSQSKAFLIETALDSDALPISLAWIAELSMDGVPIFGEARLFDVTIPLVDLIPNLSLEDWREVSHELLPPEMAVDWIEGTVDGLERWLRIDPSAGETMTGLPSAAAAPQVQYDLRPLKNRALSNHGLRALEIALKASPACTSRQVARLVAISDPTELDRALLSLHCAAPEPYEEDQFYAHAGKVPMVVANIRDTFSLEEALLLESNPSTARLLEFARTLIRRLRPLALYAPAIPLGLLLVISILVVRSWADLARAWNPWLAAGGLITILLSALSGEVIVWLLDQFPAGIASTELLEATRSLVISRASEITWPLFLRGLAAVLLGEALRLAGRRARILEPTTPRATGEGLIEAS